MALWIIFAVMTAGAVLAVLWPLGRKSVAASGGSDRLVYQDQLQEITRDRAAGLIGEAEAESARVEISRRLLAAADAETPATGALRSSGNETYRRVAALAAIVVVPAVAVLFYADLGSPDVPVQSAFAPAENPHGAETMDDLVAKVEAHLASDPKDGSGWELIAPVYLRIGRYDDAVAAWRKAIALNGDNPAREAALGEALVAASDGVVKDDAKQAFQRALTGSPNDPKARYFLGLADEQDGKRDEAAAKWRALLADAPRGAPWAEFVRGELARVTGQEVPAPTGVSSSASSPAEGPGPSAADVSAANGMDDTQRTAMINGMVQRLADRLHANGDDVDGWLRLVRAYVVLGNRDKAKDAASDARRALQSHPDEVKQIDGLVKDLGLEG